MEPSRPKSQLFSLHSIALVMIILAGFFLSRSALESTRPAVTKPEHLAWRREKIDCRLWQDPVKAVLETEPNQRVLDKHGLKRVAEGLSKLVRGQKAPQVHVLLVMAHSGETAEDQENRLRSRQAVLAALRCVDFEPEKTKEICYFAVDIGTPNEPNDTEPNACTPDSDMLIAPYEWFKRGQLRQTNRTEPLAKNVLVLWLQDECFRVRPLSRLRHLSAGLKDEFDKLTPKATCYFSVIGPTDSPMLRKMLEEPIQPDLNGPTINIYSPWSTADPRILTYQVPEDTNGVKDANDPDIRARLNRKGFGFVRTIGTDDQLARCLIEELGRRIRRFNDSRAPAQVALNCEWDSFYGQVFPPTFAAVRSQMQNEKAGSKVSEFAGELDKVLKDPNSLRDLPTFYYIRGIDGELPGRKSSETATSKERSPSQSTTTFTEAPESPTGRSQLDYIRRMAQSLAQEYRRPWENRLKAIGIVGSDVYDKLLLLQALREEFDDVIFFTTDLDARLMHHTNFRWTRNLIVASNYDLAFNEDYQDLTLRFRDNYQTSLYLACRTALKLCTAEEKLFDQKAQELEVKLRHPRLFEIGRGCAVNVSAGPRQTQASASIHPPGGGSSKGDKDRARHYLSWIVAILVCALALLAYFSKGVRGILTALFCSKRPRFRDILGLSAEKMVSEKRYAKVVVLLILVTVLFVVVMCQDHFRGGGEPVSFLKGVSIWPGEMLRLLAGILSIFLLTKSWSDLSENQERVMDYFFRRALGERKTIEESWKAFTRYRTKRRVRGKQISQWKMLLKRWRMFLEYCAENISLFSWEAADQIKAQAVWKQYARRGYLHHRLIRIIPALAIYVVLGIFLMSTFGFGNCPYRGRVSFWTDRVVLLLSVGAMLVLMFFVVDATRLCARFIEVLKKPTDWSDILEKLSDEEKLGLDKSQLERMEGDFDEWLDIKLIAFRTEAVGRLIRYPFIVLPIMLLSRSRFFDNWNWPIGLVLTLAIYTAFALYCAVKMRRSAEKARNQAMSRLQTNLVGIEGWDKARAKKIKAMIEEIRSIKQGAFSPFSENPVIGAILIPSGGVTLLALLEMFSNS
ncbi:MAG: hypothetical protein ACYS4W_08510 [Planctomycetota bacterium]|jgi:hypothetical protein